MHYDYADFKRILNGLRNGCWHIWRHKFRHWRHDMCSRCHDAKHDGLLSKFLGLNVIRKK